MIDCLSTHSYGTVAKKTKHNRISLPLYIIIIICLNNLLNGNPTRGVKNTQLSAFSVWEGYGAAWWAGGRRVYVKSVTVHCVCFAFCKFRVLIIAFKRRRDSVRNRKRPVVNVTFCCAAVPPFRSGNRFQTDILSFSLSLFPPPHSLSLSLFPPLTLSLFLSFSVSLCLSQTMAWTIISFAYDNIVVY